MDLLKEVILLFSDNFLEINDIYENTDFDYFKIKKHDNKLDVINNFKRSPSRIGSIISMDVIEPEDVLEYFVQRIIPPFSIQFICRLGELYGQGPGKHFSDNNMIQIFKELNTEFRPIPELEIFWCENNLIEKSLIDRFMFKIEDPKYITEHFDDLYLFKGDYYELKEPKMSNIKGCFSKPYDTWNSQPQEIFETKKRNISGAIFVSLRLGLNSVSKEYLPSLIKFFSLPSNIGFIGGENFKGFYYIGVNDNNELLFLDPHMNQRSFKGYSELKTMSQTYLPQYICKLPVDKISPGLTLGFLFHSMKEFKILIKELKKFSEGPNSILKMYEEEKKQLDSKSIMCIEVEDDFD
eukprot:CAMPEP_0170521488 /NCGR_PEP_ID=MMETSP0209-20121228/6848_1 /TAXON_ID=665100 ORGANISM="Litonotus pictus, Strain P1" /NCGR_SAMPLE_ID=MMETSP0209 /ASSEMBLY_ACC=CAM_ASM_000301 /LENGTH=351 /DNA_ID=CAMNT_0010808383 /DNA_START=601 /DNA_END=1653 /DNA_ORIENTATION=+